MLGLTEAVVFFSAPSRLSGPPRLELLQTLTVVRASPRAPHAATQSRPKSRSQSLRRDFLDDRAIAGCPLATTAALVIDTAHRAARAVGDVGGRVDVGGVGGVLAADGSGVGGGAAGGVAVYGVPSTPRRVRDRRNL